MVFRVWCNVFVDKDCLDLMWYDWDYIFSSIADTNWNSKYCFCRVFHVNDASGLHKLRWVEHFHEHDRWNLLSDIPCLMQTIIWHWQWKSVLTIFELFMVRWTCKEMFELINVIRQISSSKCGWFCWNHQLSAVFGFTVIHCHTCDSDHAECDEYTLPMSNFTWF